MCIYKYVDMFLSSNFTGLQIQHNSKTKKETKNIWS